MTDPTVTPAEQSLEIPEGIRRSLAALRRDLPGLLASWWKRGKWVCYAGDERIGISRDYLKLIRKIAARGFKDGEFIIERIRPGAGSEEEEEIESNFF